MFARKTIVFAVAIAILGVGCKKSDSKDKEKPVSVDKDNKDPKDNADQKNNADPKGAAKDSPEVKAFATKCREGVEKAKKALPALLAVKGERTVDNTLKAFNQLTIMMGHSDALSGLFQSVHPDENIREAARECEQDLSKFRTEIGLNRELYDAIVKLEGVDMPPRAKRMVAHTLRDFRRNGVDRDEATRSRLKEIHEELTKVGQEFSKNISEDVREVLLDSVDDLKGLPEDYIKGHAPGKDGKIKITTNYPDYIPFMSYAESTKWRKAIYIQSRSRGGEENEKKLKRILVLRAEQAKLLGSANYADYITADKMIKSGKNASDFIDRVVKVADKRAKSDYTELLARKRKDEPNADHVADYEKVFYENKVKAESYAFDPQSVRPYFEYEQTEKGLLEITSTIYDVQYKRVTDADVWHTSVKVFDVMRGATKLGRIYLDMHPRKGKYKHAAQFTKVEGVEGIQLPEGVLVCNFPDPAKSKGPALMEHDDVVTMFHEFGHLMHHVFGGQQRWVRQSGVATEWDFVEAPSQMFEEWAWNHESLSLFAKHHETGEVIPKDLVDKMRKAKKFGLGLAAMQQMFYASISLNFHQLDPSTLDMASEVKRLQAKLTPFRFVEGTRFHANFGHLNGYSAIYYTYMWSMVIAKDLLTPFKKHGLMNTEWTKKYRDAILVPGGTKDAADLVKDFLGREYKYDAFEDYLGS